MIWKCDEVRWRLRTLDHATFKLLSSAATFPPRQPAANHRYHHRRRRHHRHHHRFHDVRNVKTRVVGTEDGSCNIQCCSSQLRLSHLSAIDIILGIVILIFHHSCISTTIGMMANKILATTAKDISDRITNRHWSRYIGSDHQDWVLSLALISQFLNCVPIC